MANLWFACNVWNEEMMLPGCLESIRKYNPEAKIVAVDGAYKSLVDEVKKLIAQHYEKRYDEVARQFEPYTEAQSTDRTLEILKEFKADIVIECEKGSDGKALPWEKEYVKRSRYFVGSPGDYYFVIDADERLQGRLEWEKLTENGYNVVLKRDDETVPYEVLRIFKHHDGIRYYGAHHALWIGETLYKKETCQAVPGVLLNHLSVYRTTKDPIRNRVKGAYYGVLCNVEEGAFRAQHGL